MTTTDIFEIMRRVIKVYCGTDIEDYVCFNLHPLTQVKNAIYAIDEGEKNIYCSNSPDFVQTIYHYSKENGVQVDFYLSGKLQRGIEGIFKDFNAALDLMAKKLGKIVN